jgi:hypothetical protein
VVSTRLSKRIRTKKRNNTNVFSEPKRRRKRVKERERKRG